MDGEAIGTIALARIPTVTKPCLKSIFSGSLPAFFELVENIDESGMSTSVQSIPDNLLTRLHLKGKKICLYGDDVWSKLFPMKMFHRSKVDYGLNIMVRYFDCLTKANCSTLLFRTILMSIIWLRTGLRMKLSTLTPTSCCSTFLDSIILVTPFLLKKLW